MGETYLSAVPVRALFVDEAYQRPADERRIARMAREWDPELVGAIDVSDRGIAYGDQHDGERFAVINGQHRWRAALRRDPGMSLACNVHQGLLPQDEARLFWDIDRTTKQLSTWDRWRARLEAGDDDVVRIVKICAGLGCPVSEGATGYSIKSTAALEAMYRIDEWGLTATLELVMDVWPADNEGLRGAILRGLHPVVLWCEPARMSGRLADVLAAIVPSQVYARALANRQQQSAGGGQVWMAVTRVVVDLYNAGLPARDRLPVGEVIRAGRSGRVSAPPASGPGSAP